MVDSGSSPDSDSRAGFGYEADKGNEHDAACLDPIVLGERRVCDNGAWFAIGASSTGSDHLAGGFGCQDALGVWLAEGMQVAVIADGAGSASHAAAGSRCATEALLEAVTINPEPGKGGADAPVVWFEEVRGRLCELAGELDIPLGALATTLACAVVTPTAITVGQVGDGVVVAQHPDGSLGPVASCSRNEYLNETTFVTSPSWREAMATAVIDPTDVAGLVLTTDGLEMVCLEDRRNIVVHEPFFDSLLAAAREGATSGAIARYLDRVDDRTGDDKTLLVLARCTVDDQRPGEAPG